MRNIRALDIVRDNVNLIKFQESRNFEQVILKNPKIIYRSVSIFSDISHMLCNILRQRLLNEIYVLSFKVSKTEARASSTLDKYVNFKRDLLDSCHS